MNRRSFVSTVAAGASAAAAAQVNAGNKIPVKKGVIESMLPKGMSMTERFRVAKDVGFEVIECHTEEDPVKLGYHSGEVDTHQRRGDCKKDLKHNSKNVARG